MTSKTSESQAKSQARKVRPRGSIREIAPGQVSGALCFRSATHCDLVVRRNKTGDDRWYETNALLADRLYEQYLSELKKEGLL